MIILWTTPRSSAKNQKMLIVGEEDNQLITIYFNYNRNIQLKMNVKLTLVLLFFLSHCADGIWNCRNLACFLKEGRTLKSPTLMSWKFRSCGSIGGLSCSAANDRVPSRCQKDLNNPSVQKDICNKKASSIPEWPGKLTVKVTKMGKADCKSNDANNFWMDKDSHGIPKQQSICCTKYRKYPWEPLTIHVVPC